MSKPDWKYAPHWANWMAKDKDGQWRVFENQPTADIQAEFHLPNMGRHEVIVRWEESQEPRP